ncbi:hypothetical protein SNEBB_003158 [Seison nebaliae]|nr:hypothetical protein SNEBB_003158 [Seison nebaliae]
MERTRRITLISLIIFVTLAASIATLFTVLKLKGTKMTKPLIELHVHVDGAISYDTVKKLAKLKGVEPPPFNETIYRKRGHLFDFLKVFEVITPLFSGDENKGLRYVEGRFAPFTLTTNNFTGEQVVEAAIRGVEKGKSSDIDVKLILCCMEHEPEKSMEIVELIEKFQGRNMIVGMDLAGGEPVTDPIDQRHIDAFKKARDLGIHRTVHAGESGPAFHVKQAIEDMFAERIGHGYHVLDDGKIYDLARTSKVHFETCPWSSWYLQSAIMPHDDWTKHPCVRFAHDDVPFSINSDDPAIFLDYINDNFDISRNGMKLSEEVLKKTNEDALAASFMSEEDKHIFRKKYF